MRNVLCAFLILHCFSCSPYNLLDAKKKKKLKEDYAARFEAIKLVAGNIVLKDNDTLCDIATGQGVSVSILANYLPPTTTYYVEDIDRTVCNRRYFKQTFRFYDAKTNIDNYKFFIGHQRTIPFQSRQFSNVTLFISIHEFKYKEQMLAEVYPILKDSGKAYVLEAVSKDNLTYKDPTCGFNYLTDHELTKVVETAKCKILKDTFAVAPQSSDKLFAKLLILGK